jgi:hypothetical protein
VAYGLVDRVIEEREADTGSRSGLGG